MRHIKKLLFTIGVLIPTCTIGQTTYTASGNLDLSAAILDKSGTSGAEVSGLAKAALPITSKDIMDGYVGSGAHNNYPWDNPNETNKPIIKGFGTEDTANINPDTLVLGGDNWADVYMQKATCQTYSEGDEGGVCYEFDDMSGSEGWHRNGAGVQDGINVGMMSQDNEPLLTVGGNGTTKNTDGIYSVTGNPVTTTADAAVGADSVTVTGPVSCGNPNIGMYCSIIARTSVFGDGTSSTFTTNGRYSTSTNTTTITLPKGLSAKIPKGTALTWFVHAPDGVAYGIPKLAENYMLITPQLSSKMLAVLRPRISVYLNVAHGFSEHEHTTNYSLNAKQFKEHDGVDHPNYYYGFESAVDNSNSNVTKIVVESDQYPGTGTHPWVWRTMSDYGVIPNHDKQPVETVRNSIGARAGAKDIVLNTGWPVDISYSKVIVSGTGVSSGTVGTSYVDSTHNWTHLVLSKPLTKDAPVNTVFTLTAVAADGTLNYGPLNMPGDSYDYTLTYLGADGNTYHNTNFHGYPAPTAFIGMNGKNFNMYWATSYSHLSDSITRDFDNELDFWTGGKDHPGETSSRGLTLVWTGGNSLSDGSWMMRLAGTNLMPLGLQIDGVFPNGGVELATDAGFFIIRNRDLDPTGNAAKPNPITMLGMGRASSSSFGQLAFFENQDDGTNPTYHLGLIASPSSDTLMYNVDPNCGGCTEQGQIVFKSGTTNDIELGYGIGASYVAGLTVNAYGTVDLEHVVNFMPGSMLNFRCASCSTDYPFHLALSSDGTSISVGYQIGGGGNIININGLYANTLNPNNHTLLFADIKKWTVSEGAKVYCHDCRSPGQATGAGTGRWITLDSKSTWRTEDGLVASN